MTVTNNKRNVRYLFYSVGGKVKSLKFGPSETKEVSDLTSSTQIKYNALDFKLKGINERFNRNFVLNFTAASNEASVTPSPLIEDWYDSLSVKPSNALMTDLNTLVDGIDSDGNWSLLDLFGLIAGMETQEQQLKPLITTSGEDFVIVGTPILNSNGARNNTGAGYLNLKWNPVDDGVQYAADSAFISTQIGEAIATFGSEAGFMGAFDESQPAAEGTSYLTYADSPTNRVSGAINFDGVTSTTPGIVNGTTTYYLANVIVGGNYTIYKNAVTNSLSADAATILTNLDFYGCDFSYSDGSPASSFDNALLRHFMAGNGTANQTEIQTRLNTFYSSRGL